MIAISWFRRRAVALAAARGRDVRGVFGTIRAPGQQQQQQQREFTTLAAAVVVAGDN